MLYKEIQELSQNFNAISFSTLIKCGWWYDITWYLDTLFCRIKPSFMLGVGSRLISCYIGRPHHLILTAENISNA